MSVVIRCFPDRATSLSIQFDGLIQGALMSPVLSCTDSIKTVA